MKLIHVLCSVEFFGYDRPAPGTAPVLRLEGWHLSHGRTQTMSLVLPGETETVIDIPDHRRPSEGVFDHHGGSFGESAREARFLLTVPDASGRLDLSRPLLRVQFEDGVRSDYTLTPVADVPAERRPDGATSDDVGDGADRFGLLPHGSADRGSELESAARTTDAYALAARIETRVGADAGMADACLDALHDEDSVLVFCTRQGGREGRIGMERLYEAMQTAGRAKLLWVSEAGVGQTAGRVEQVRTRLFHGTVDRLPAGGRAGTDAPDGWVAMLAAARETIGRTAGPTA